jgi:hypothetical protein
MVRKNKIFQNEDESDNEKRSGGTQKVKYDIGFLGCVKCSKNDDYWVSAKSMFFLHAQLIQKIGREPY